ncbi:MAG: magnesium transporter MgtE N-terminal domain-containing protein [Arenicellales bacterium WSBS_2016_MAG_OTU3]
MPNIEQEDVLARALAALEEDNVSDIRLLMSALHPADVAKLLEGLPPEQRPAVWYEVPTVAMGEVLTEVSDGVREGLTENMDRERLVEAVRTLDIDDIADVVPDLPEDAIARILLAVDTEARQELDAVLAYDEDSAGGLMNTDTTTVRASITLAVAICASVARCRNTRTNCL